MKLPLLLLLLPTFTLAAHPPRTLDLSNKNSNLLLRRQGIKSMYDGQNADPPLVITGFGAPDCTGAETKSNTNEDDSAKYGDDMDFPKLGSLNLSRSLMDDEQLDISRNPGKKRLRSRSRSLFANDDVGGLDERDGTIPADCMEFVATAPMSIDAGCWTIPEPADCFRLWHVQDGTFTYCLTPEDSNCGEI
ncbi:hypothetical protein MMC28_002618 [Mycoblastus sanguinarius]|nr:hypothetical protein [Mycoblastus sanguinarius]